MSFATLQRTENVRNAGALYRAIYIIFNSKRESDAVLQSRDRILQAQSVCTCVCTLYMYKLYYQLFETM